MDMKSFGKVCEKIVADDNADLFSKNIKQLEEYWHFDFNKVENTTECFYNFFKALDLYGHYCRRWEEHFNGSLCVVERVRDQYLYPKIILFQSELGRVDAKLFNDVANKLDLDPIKIEDDHYNCGSCGCSWFSYKEAQNCRHGYDNKIKRF